MTVQEHTKPRLLVLIGPTAVGKTRISIDIAKRFACEIISGDSMQVYRGMNIGTAKASDAEREEVPHHLIDIVEPEEAFSAADFQSKAQAAIADIHSRGKLPLIVGGTGLYIESLCYGFHFSEAVSDDVFRAEQTAYLHQNGEEALHQRLREIDPTSAARLHPNDTRRIIRALEIYHLTGSSMSEQLARQNKESAYDLCLIGLTMDRTLLYNRIEQRIDEMLDAGLVKEVSTLLERGCTADMVAMQALGYKEMLRFLLHELTYERAVELLKRDTRHYAKRQLSWFRHMKDIQWIDMGDGTNISEPLLVIHDIIAGKFS